MLTERQIDNRGKKRAALLEQMAALQEQVDAIDNEMKAECERLGVDTLTGETYEATWRRRISNRFQSADFKRDHGDLYKAYQKQTEERPFTFRPMTEARKAELKAQKALALDPVTVTAVRATA